MKRILFLILGLALNLALFPHPWKPSHYVIIDTDGGIDDMRAITMLLASPDVRVLALTVSPGALSAENAYIKVKSLLNSFYHEGIPVGINRKSRYKSKENPVPLNYFWGSEDGIYPKSAPDFTDIIKDILSSEKTKISFISLGSMSTAYLALSDIPAFRQQVKEIIWSADGSGDTSGFNYNLEKDASIRMLRQDIPVKIVRKFDLIDADFYNEEFIKEINLIKTAYAKKISEFFSSDLARDHRFSFSATDEMVAVFLHYPDLFINKIAGSNTECYPSDLPGLSESTLRILKCETIEKNQVIKE
ncbi:MAG: nucleoside hydrolase, partial [Bacteroidales bacterium]|nr:nucleoside hydrolase [Bacteroidales bacterium]